MFKKLTRKAISEAADTLTQMAGRVPVSADEDTLNKEDVLYILAGALILGAAGFYLGRRSAPDKTQIIIVPVKGGA